MVRECTLHFCKYCLLLLLLLYTYTYTYTYTYYCTYCYYYIERNIFHLISYFRCLKETEPSLMVGSRTRKCFKQS